MRGQARSRGTIARCGAARRAVRQCSAIRVSARSKLSINGGGKFHDVSASNPALCGAPGVGRSLIVADLEVLR